MAAAVNLQVKARNNESPERLVKRFQKRVKKERIIEKYKERSRFRKPSEKRREKLKRAIRKREIEGLKEEKKHGSS